jgi:7tm Chemosensory receptor
MAMFNIILNILSICGPCVIPVSQYSELKANFLAGFDSNNIAVMVLQLIGGIFASLIFILPNYFFLLIGIVLTIDFRHLSHDLELSIDEEGSWVSNKSLEWFRIRHSSLCTLLELADGIFSPWILLNIGVGTLQVLASIFVIYARGGSSKTLTILTVSYWMLSYVLQIALALYTGVIVNEAVCEGLKNSDKAIFLGITENALGAGLVFQQTSNTDAMRSLSKK